MKPGLSSQNHTILLASGALKPKIRNYRAKAPTVETIEWVWGEKEVLSSIEECKFAAR